MSGTGSSGRRNRAASRSATKSDLVGHVSHVDDEPIDSHADEPGDTGNPSNLKSEIHNLLTTNDELKASLSNAIGSTITDYLLSSPRLAEDIAKVICENDNFITSISNKVRDKVSEDIGEDLHKASQMEFQRTSTSFQLKAYPPDIELESVVSALIRKFPCLTDSSTSGCDGWKTSMKFKMGNLTIVMSCVT